MKKSARELLDQDIILLDIRRNEELKGLKSQFHDVYENLKPINQVKHLIHEITDSPDIKKGVGKAAIGMASGFLVKNILFGGTRNPLLKLAGMAVQSIVTNITAKNADKITDKGKNIVQSITSKLFPKKEEKEVFSESEMYK